jgi:hypothetical protein
MGNVLAQPLNPKTDFIGELSGLVLRDALGKFYDLLLVLNCSPAC